jgi:hypothetical protein
MISLPCLVFCARRAQLALSVRIIGETKAAGCFSNSRATRHANGVGVNRYFRWV